jgi:GxxExxY protein
MRWSDMDPELNRITGSIIDAAIEVQGHFGPGTYETMNQLALAHELRLRGHTVGIKVPVPVVYKGVQVGDAYEADLFVDDQIVVELKSVERLHRVHFVQLQTYLRLVDRPLGLLINFGELPLYTKRMLKGDYKFRPSRDLEDADEKSGSPAVEDLE